MATSGVTTWQLTRDEFVTAALRKLGVLYEGEVPSASQLLTGVEALNGAIKMLQAKGMPLWAIAEYTFNTVVDQVKYPIGVGMAFNTPAPLKVIQATRTEVNASNSPLNIITHYDYNLLPKNDSSGVPVNFWYEPLNGTGNIYLWPKPMDTTTTITITYQRPFEDAGSSLNNIDIPSYWSLALIYYTARILAPEYGTSKEDRASLVAEAKDFIEEALSFGTEEGSLYLSPDWTRS